MAQYPYLPLWTDAYLADTTHLTTRQHGAYLLMLMAAWRVPECRLPDDDRHLARITGMSPATWRKDAPALRAFWRAQDGFLYQKRLCKEREKAQERSEKAARAARTKWQKSNDTGDADVVPEQCLRDASIPIPRSMNENSDSIGDEKKGIGVRIDLLKSATYEQAHRLAPGYDIYYLEGRWREWCEGKSIRDPDRAFLGFVKKHVEKNPL